ncbi:hypothetical protein ACRRTK_001154 [Alexandromys fortis]
MNFFKIIKESNVVTNLTDVMSRMWQVIYHGLKRSHSSQNSYWRKPYRCQECGKSFTQHAIFTILRRNLTDFKNVTSISVSKPNLISSLEQSKEPWNVNTEEKEGNEQVLYSHQTQEQLAQGNIQDPILKLVSGISSWTEQASIAQALTAYHSC